MSGGTSAEAADASPAAPSRPWPPFAGVAAATILLLALVLRILGARGDLWLDEIWSAKLAGLLRDGRFLLESLALDNNHYLNTLYLILVGPDASPLLQRALSILLGCAAVPVAGYAARRSGTPGVLAAMAEFGVAYFFVNYGSEARGYAGLTLATLLAVVLVERAWEQPEGKARAWLAVTAITGFLFQPIMLVSLAMLALWIAWLSWRRSGSLQTALAATWRLFVPTAAALAPLAILIGGAVLRAGGYLIAAKTPFSFAHFLVGYAGLFRALFGIPDAVPDLPILAIPLGALIATRWIDARPRASLGVIALLFVPLAVVLAHPPNVQYPRYYLVSGVVVMLILADISARAWRSGLLWRGVATVLAVATIAGNVAELSKLFRDGRGDPVPALREIAASGKPALLDVRDMVVVEYLAPRYGLNISVVQLERLCIGRPAFILTSSDGPQPDTVAVNGAGCTLYFQRESTTETWGLSGTPWTLYRASE